jgi:lipoate-protein ligase A
MYLFDLGERKWQESMLVFHALARMGIEGIDIVSPRTPYISIGYFQDATKEVDLEYCEKEGLPIIRREVGGGTVYLDRNQIFYHVVWNRNNPRYPKLMKDIYEYFAIAPIETYGEFGIKTEFRSVNDIITGEGRKIAGLGGGDIADSMSFVGSVILDFDYDKMAHAIKVPDEKFRDKVFKTMTENVTSMKRELGTLPPRGDIIRVLEEKFTKCLGKLESVELSEDVIKKMKEIALWFSSPEFLFRKTPRIPDGVKIKEGIELIYTMYKAKGGLIRTQQEVEKKKRIKDIGLSGDFTLYPKAVLDTVVGSLKGSDRKEKVIKDKIEEAYDKKKIETPGVTPDDFTKAVLKDDE